MKNLKLLYTMYSFFSSTEDDNNDKTLIVKTIFDCQSFKNVFNIFI